MFISVKMYEPILFTILKIVHKITILNLSNFRTVLIKWLTNLCAIIL